MATSTESDSVGAGNPYTAYFVQARGPSGYIANSQPDSGYSVDNLAPRLPLLTSAQYGAGASRLHWLPNTERDLFGYIITRGGNRNFVPDVAHPVAIVTDTGYADPASGPLYYKIAAKDKHGNIGPFATILPTGTTDVPGDVGLALTLSGVRPNPSMSQALVVDFTLPSPSPATVEFLDVMGRRLVRLDVTSMGAGRHTVDLAAHVRLAPGRYSLRLTQGGESRVSQVVVTP